jgi:CheY-like chemotaxis protein
MKTLRVMIVEDNGVIADLLAELIDALGHVVCAVEASETAAVAAAGRSKPDLMIVDAQLQDGNGIGAVDTILRFGHIPHIFSSGNASSVKRLKPDATVLQKPYLESDLVRAIQSALSKAEAI